MSVVASSVTTSAGSEGADEGHHDDLNVSGSSSGYASDLQSPPQELDDHTGQPTNSAKQLTLSCLPCGSKPSRKGAYLVAWISFAIGLVYIISGTILYLSHNWHVFIGPNSAEDGYDPALYGNMTFPEFQSNRGVVIEEVYVNLIIYGILEVGISTLLLFGVYRTKWKELFLVTIVKGIILAYGIIAAVVILMDCELVTVKNPKSNKSGGTYMEKSDVKVCPGIDTLPFSWPLFLPISWSSYFIWIVLSYTCELRQTGPQQQQPAPQVMDEPPPQVDTSAEDQNIDTSTV